MYLLGYQGRRSEGLPSIAKQQRGREASGGTDRRQREKGTQKDIHEIQGGLRACSDRHMETKTASWMEEEQGERQQHEGQYNDS